MRSVALCPVCLCRCVREGSFSLRPFLSHAVQGALPDLEDSLSSEEAAELQHN